MPRGKREREQTEALGEIDSLARRDNEARACESVSDRVAYVADLMAKGEYRTRLTGKWLSQLWGLAETTIGGYAAEASRLLQVPSEERGARRAVMAAWFEARANDAATRRSFVTGLPDMGAALKAMELYGRYAGLEADDATTSEPPHIVISFEPQSLAQCPSSESNSTGPKVKPGG